MTIQEELALEEALLARLELMAREQAIEEFERFELAPQATCEQLVALAKMKPC